MSFGWRFFEASWWMFVELFAKPAVEDWCADGRLARFGDFSSHFKQFCDILATNGARKDEWRPRDKVEFPAEVVGDLVTTVRVLVVAIPFADHDYQPLARLFYHAGDFLVELGCVFMDIE